MNYRTEKICEKSWQKCKKIEEKKNRVRQLASPMGRAKVLIRQQHVKVNWRQIAIPLALASRMQIKASTSATKSERQKFTNNLQHFSFL